MYDGWYIGSMFLFYVFFLLVLYVSYFARSDLVVIEDPYVIVYK